MIRVVMRGERKSAVMRFRRGRSRRGRPMRRGRVRRMVNRKRRVSPRRIGFRL